LWEQSRGFMARIINAVDAVGQWFSVSIIGGVFRDLQPQAGRVEASGPCRPLMSAADLSALAAEALVDAAGLTLVPGAVDVHVHSRDPGLTAKEDWHTLAQGAWRGGVVAVCDMPNTLPPTMTREAVLFKAERAAASGLEFKLLVGVGAGNVNHVGELLAASDLPVCALKVFYGRTTGELMYDDLETLARSIPETCNKPLVFHSEDQCTVDCNQARLASKLKDKDNSAFEVHSDIRSSAAAHQSTRVILEWARTTYKRPIHIAHVSTPLEIELVTEAKARGVLVTAEVAPHHLLFSTDDYARLGPLVKMNPPLRYPAEVEQLNKLVGQGLVDIFATDHAPHLLAEKYASVGSSPSGVPGVELFYPLLWTVAKRTGLPFATALAMGASRPAELFGFAQKGRIANGFDADFAVLVPSEHVITQQDTVAKCGWTPYAGLHRTVDIVATWNRGRQVYSGPDSSLGQSFEH